ncbi:MAG: DNA mismatch repair protein MutS [Candidatus Saganbacteria bacterium]|nr:DNA mismatch repair protein MutS [Candidatus Saganbacteria bacterium]
MAEVTPMVKQYLSIKEKHQDAILFFRLGDFYEMFYDDAEKASKELDLVLTGRGKDENRMPMCGIPFHAAENYIARLIDRGYKVAICEQVEDPKDAKGVVKRDVIRIVTPGTVIEANLLKEKTNNYLLAVSKEKNKFGLAYVDASTGEFRLTVLESKEKVLDEVNRVAPSEIILADLLEKEFHFQQPTSLFKDIYDAEAAEDKLKRFFSIKTLESFGLAEYQAGWGAAAAIIDYLKETQKTGLQQIRTLKAYRTSAFMFIDAATRHNLELVQTIRDKTYKGSLLWVLDRTRTSMGGRLLKQWLLQPLLEKGAIKARLEAVAELNSNAVLRAELGQEIAEIADIERATGRIASATANARDLIALKESLKRLPKIRMILKDSRSALLEPRRLAAGSEQELLDLIAKAIVDDPPFALKDGGLVRSGYDEELDIVKRTALEGKDWISKLENEERRRTGIKSLKVGYTRVFGYYIEVTKANLSQVPENYIRKQTLVNAERFITPELKEKESLILNADERMKDLDYKIFCDVRSKVAESTAELQAMANILAQLDVLLSLAEVAVENNYCCPKIQNQKSEIRTMRISGSRHPVVEKTLGEHRFVPNNVDLNDLKSRFLLITGPNMAGKSTYMRQVALTSLLAQIGSFVPAKEADLCLVDRIFTRIGAMDDIFSGQSTFMMEMTETANILNNATENSLIILDEIGRGTATFDGMSIAAAVAEYIHTKIKAKTLFATHYHEITQLAEKHKGMKNLNVTVKEEGDHVTFLHQIAEGPADRSYGIQVGKLAGLPAEVIKRAKEVYATLEMVENDMGKFRGQGPVAGSQRKKTKASDQNQVSLF